MGTRSSRHRANFAELNFQTSHNRNTKLRRTLVPRCDLTGFSPMLLRTRVAQTVTGQSNFSVSSLNAVAELRVDITSRREVQHPVRPSSVPTAQPADRVSRHGRRRGVSDLGGMQRYKAAYRGDDHDDPWGADERRLVGTRRVVIRDTDPSLKSRVRARPAPLQLQVRRPSPPRNCLLSKR